MDKPIEVGPLGEALEALRRRAGLTLYQLGQQSGVNRSQLMRMENGTIRTPTTETLNKVAAALQVDPEEFYDAVWTGSGDPLPSLPTYFRNKYRLSDDQIAAVERTMRAIERQSPSAKAPAARKRTK